MHKPGGLLDASFSQILKIGILLGRVHNIPMAGNFLTREYSVELLYADKEMPFPGNTLPKVSNLLECHEKFPDILLCSFGTSPVL